MNMRRYTNEDLEKAYSSGYKKGTNILLKDIMNISKEFIHPKLHNQFLEKLKKILKENGVKI